jgi:hypothetical protein
VQYCLLLCFYGQSILQIIHLQIQIPHIRFTISMVWKNLTVLSTCITYATTISTDFGVLVCVIRFLDLSTKDPSSYTNLLPNPNSNGCPYANLSLLAGTYSSSGFNTIKGVCVSILSVNSLVACRPPYVYYCCCKCCGLLMVSI